ncbi:MAG: Gfo/Idh/MocA family oxidoreductase [Planctomycetota bacterium]|nr:Gfo/Idh/MocA family oxidoreductase [Planctomycetota bacterium]
MKRTTRRDFLKTSVTGGLALGLPNLGVAQRRLQAAGPNAEVRVAVVGLGGIDTIGGVGGRGRQLIRRLQEVPGARVVALCDVDQAVLDQEVQPFKDRHEVVGAYTDIRKLLDDKRIDAVAIATPNHWHALATIWACQAGKDVYVEKPFSYNIWEGRQMVAAARKFGRMVQVGTQSRSSEVLRQAIEYLRSGEVGPIRYAHAIVYRARDGIGKVGAPAPVSPTVDYDLWCGPAPRTPLLRQQLHYDWHWFWSTGNGEIGNNGAHSIDVCRWALGQLQPPPRAMSIGGRFAFHDDGETPNTQIALLDYQPAPLICEIRNVKAAKGTDTLGKFRNLSQGVVIDCAGGYFAGDASGGTVFDTQGRKIKEFRDDRKPHELALSISHLANFVAAVRSRNIGDLHAEALQGHISAACSHIANASYRIGQRSEPHAILETIRSNRELADAFERCREHLQANGVDLAVTPAVAGPWVTLDSTQERFVGEFADQANEVSQRAYRKPFVVPEVA